MNTSELCRFESFILNDTPLQQLWNNFSPHLNSTVENVENARSIYSNALKITRHVAKEEKIMAVWLDLYLRVEDMDHYVRKRPDIINESFEWLKNQL